MEKINVEQLGQLTQINYGSYCRVYRCSFEGAKCVYKKFNKPNDFLDSDLESKFAQLNKLSLKRSQFPNFIVTEADIPKGYLSFELDDDDYSVADLEYKFYVISETKKAIMELHENGIIHTDIHQDNIILSENNITLIDFDNCFYNGFNPKEQYYSDFVKLFVKKYGLGKNLDIYLFNLFVYSYINDEFNYSDILNNIKKGDYGLFTNEEAKSICDSLTLENSCFDNRYLIDTLDYKTVLKTLQLKKRFTK